jgi:hypothetical protein
VRFERFGGQKAMALAQKPRGAARAMIAFSTDRAS